MRNIIDFINEGAWNKNLPEICDILKKNRACVISEETDVDKLPMIGTVAPDGDENNRQKARLFGVAYLGWLDKLKSAPVLKRFSEKSLPDFTPERTVEGMRYIIKLGVILENGKIATARIKSLEQEPNVNIYDIIKDKDKFISWYDI
jgi:hypothetical protein